MEELIGAIRVIKMYCWESFSIKKIINFRTIEIKLLELRGTILGFMAGIVYFAVYIVTTLTFLYVIFNANQFRASDVFTTFTLGGIMGLYLRIFKETMYTLAEIKNTNRRITEVLLLDESVQTPGVKPDMPKKTFNDVQIW